MRHGRILAVILAAAMVFGGSLTAQAAEMEGSFGQETQEDIEDVAEEEYDIMPLATAPAYSYTAKNVPLTDLTFSSSGGVSGSVIRSTLESLITSHEGNSTSINKNDNGTLSIGRLQFRGVLALELMRLIVAADNQAAYDILGASLYSEITNSSTTWEARPVSDSEAALLSNLLGQQTSLAVQDIYVNSLLSMYLNQAYKEGFRNVTALLYYGDICNHLGMNYGTKFGKYAINIADGDVSKVTANEMHLASICYIYDLKTTDAERYNAEYIPLRRKVYGQIVDLAQQNGWAYCNSGDSVIPYDTNGTNGTKWLQNALNFYLGAGLTVDGSYGNETKAAVKTFQQMEGLTQSGYADEKTSSLLIYRIYSNKAQTGGPRGTAVTDIVLDSATGKWIYTANGVPEYTYTGVAKNAYGWWYVKDGVVDFSYTGFAKNSYGTWYIEGGKVIFNTNTVMQGTVNGENGWWYVVGGQVQLGYTGVANYANPYGWWYVKNGKVDFSANTVAQNNYGWWYVVGGEVQFGYTGVSNYENPYGWWYIKAGKVDFSANTVAQNQWAWWYVVGGKVQFNYTGVANYANPYGWWYIKNGKVDFSVNTVAQNNYGWWYVVGGKVQFGYTGVSDYGNSYGYWYIKNGKVDFSAHTVAQNKYGFWYVKNGQVDFSYTGPVTVSGKTYSVKNGKATE